MTLLTVLLRPTLRLVFNAVFRVALATLLLMVAAGWAATPSGADRVAAAIGTIRTLDPPGRDNLATVWDGNKYIQCRRMRDRTLRCEAGGSLMQVSLAHVLTPERIERLVAMGWRLDTSFGNYVQSFAPDIDNGTVADKILAALAQGYDADPQALKVKTTTIASEPCPPRNGPSQNLAGVINDAPSMAADAVHGCFYRESEAAPGEAAVPIRQPEPENSAAYVIAIHGPAVTAEIRRLRVNLHRDIFAVFDAGIGYVQCRPVTEPDGVYCEAQSAYSWATLAGVLTPERIARLHRAGFADPGRAQNYARTYLASQVTDADLAAALLTLLHDVYGYSGASALKLHTEGD